MNKYIHMLSNLLSNKHFQRIIRYVIIGGMTTMVSFGTCWVMAYPLGMEQNLANTLSVILAVLFAYITNKIYVFRSHCDTLSQLIVEGLKFFSSRAFTMFLEIGGVFVLSSLLAIELMISKAIMNVIVLILNYVFSQFIVFKTASES